MKTRIESTESVFAVFWFASHHSHNKSDDVRFVFGCVVYVLSTGLDTSRLLCVTYGCTDSPSVFVENDS